VLALGLIGLFGTWAAHATPVINSPETWSNDGNVEGWEHSGDGSYQHQDANDYLQISFDAQGAPLPESSLTFADSDASGGRFVGDYGPYLGNVVMTFRFLAETHAPSTMQMWFRSDASGAERIWSYNLSGPTTVGVWTWYSVPLGTFGPGWTLWSGSGSAQSDFLLDLTGVDWIGLRLVRNGSILAQNYGLDDVKLMVPEPETIWLMIAALLSLGVTFRGRLSEVAGRCRGWFARS
jgi:hypothetical protein